MFIYFQVSRSISSAKEQLSGETSAVATTAEEAVSTGEGETTEAEVTLAESAPEIPVAPSILEESALDSALPEDTMTK